MVKTELGPVKFTKPLAYQEIDGNRVEVAVKYRILETRGCTTATGGQAAGEQRGREAREYSKLQNSETPQLTYSFEVASYDKTKDLIIDPLLASTYLGGVYEDHGKSIAIDAGETSMWSVKPCHRTFPQRPALMIRFATAIPMSLCQSLTVG